MKEQYNKLSVKYSETVQQIFFDKERKEEIKESDITCCQWCGEEFEESEEIYKTNWGFICSYCIQALKSRGEKVVIYEKI